MTSKKTTIQPSENLNIKGGVLIIGSLLWQAHLDNKKQDNIRKLWRDRHLLVSHKIMVKVPIRYGRLSNSNIYTITFSNSVAKNKMGTGFFVPFQQTPIATFNDLINQSKEVSVAEGMKGQFIKKTISGEIWCVLGILINPKTVDNDKVKAIYKEWKKVLDNEGGFDSKDFKQGREKPCFDPNGKLNFNWPKAFDKRNENILNSYDFIIATGTKPTKYPNVDELKTKVQADNTRYYFIENYKSGITTFQDFEVINKL